MGKWQHDAIDEYHKRLDEISRDIKALEAYLANVPVTAFVDMPGGAQLVWCKGEPDHWRVILVDDGERPLIESKAYQRLAAAPYLPKLLEAVAAKIAASHPSSTGESDAD